MYHWAKFHDSAINFYVRTFRLKFAQLTKKTFEKYGLERLVNMTPPLGVALRIVTKETN